MCTALSITDKIHLFGRSLDVEASLGECAVITPRRFSFSFLYEGELTQHDALLGIAYVHQGMPLYYDAINESGLAAAALNFPNEAVYGKAGEKAYSVASFEVIPWVLTHCRSVAQAKELLSECVITSDSVDLKLPATPLHWMFADATGAFVAEPTAQGLRLYDNPYGVMTNCPPFPFYQSYLVHFMTLNAQMPVNKLCPEIPLQPYGAGMGAMGLPGDYSSASRFVRAFFSKEHACPAEDEQSAVNRFFHVLGTVFQPRGVTRTPSGAAVGTVYMSCADPASKIYYVVTEKNHSIQTIRMADYSLDVTYFSFAKEK